MSCLAHLILRYVLHGRGLRRRNQQAPIAINNNRLSIGNRVHRRHFDRDTRRDVIPNDSVLTRLRHPYRARVGIPRHTPRDRISMDCLVFPQNIVGRENFNRVQLG